VASIEARMAEQEAGELFYLDPNPMQW
jgi:hypothetical protein